MNNKSLPSTFSVKPLAVLIPAASVALISMTTPVQAAGGFGPCASPSGDVSISSACSYSGSYSSLNISGAGVNSVTVTSSGSITPPYSDAIEVDGATIAGGINNQGRVSGGFSYTGILVTAIDGATNAGNITNSGTIDGMSAIIVEDNAQVGAINNSGALIGSGYSSSYGILIEDGIAASLTNSGILEGMSGGVLVSGDGAEVASITNTQSGQISAAYGSYTGLQIADGATVNTVTNSGSISGVSILGRGNITYSSVVYGGGDLQSTSVTTFSNSGTISDGVSVAGFDNYGGPSSGEVIPSLVEVGTISNSGTISASSMSYGPVSDGAVNITDGATVGAVNNSGLIEGGLHIGESLISVGDGASALTTVGNIINSGIIDAEGPTYSGGGIYGGGIYGDGVMVTLDSPNSKTSFPALLIGGNTQVGSITNSGQINGGVLVFGGASVTGDINNQGSINSSGNPYLGALQLSGVDPSSGKGDETTVERVAFTGKIINGVDAEIKNTSISIEDSSVYGGGTVATKPDDTMTDPAGITLEHIDMAEGIYNAGLISSDNGSGIRITDSSVGYIDNSGTIKGGNDGYAIFADDDSTLGSVTNSGTLDGMLDFGANGGDYKTVGGSVTGLNNVNSITVGASSSAQGLQALVSNVLGDLTHAGALTFEANGVESGVSYGQLGVSGSADFTGATADIVVTGETFFSNGDELELVTAEGGLTTDITSFEDNSLLLDFAASTDANSLFATVEREETAAVVEELLQFVAEIEESGVDLSDPGAQNTIAIAAKLDDILDRIDSGEISESSSLGQILTQLQAEDDPQALVRAIKSLEPESGGGSSEGAVAAAGAVSAVIGNRQASLRNSYYETGMVAGDADAGYAVTGFWVQGYDKDTDQDDRQGVDGYDVDMYGLAIGADGPIDENTTVGVAISFADSEVDSKGIEGNEMGIDSYQISGYVSFNDDDYYLDALVSYARNDYEGKRNLTGGLVADADYSGDQYGLRARGGYPFVLESGLHIIPNGAVEYSYLREESYQETGAGNAGLDVDSQKLEALVLAGGVKVAYPFTTDNDVTWMPDFHAEVRHDFIADQVELDTNFVGVGGGGFSINGASVERTAYKMGVGLRTWSQSSFSFMFRYDYLYKEDYKSQSVAATVRYSF